MGMHLGGPPVPSRGDAWTILVGLIVCAVIMALAGAIA
jgi:hypothetical protein